MFQNLALSRKLAAAFGALIVIFAIVGTMVFANLSSISAAADDKENSTLALQYSQTMMNQVLEQQNAARGFAILGKDEFFKTYNESGEKFTKAANDFLSVSKLPEQQARAKQLIVEVQTLRGKLDEIIRLARNPGTRARAGELSGVKMLGGIRPLVKEIQEAQTERVKQRDASEDAAQAAAKVAILIGGAIAVALAAALGWLLSRTIATPVRDMTGVMKQLADGNNKVEVPNTDRGDEIGNMAKAVLVFRQAAIEKAASDAAKQAAEAEQKMVVDTLSQGLEKLSQGDLTAEIRVEFPGSYAAVKSNFNAALTALRSLIGAVAESTASIRTGSTEIAQASEDLARRTEANAASLEETSAAITQMDQRLKATATAATQTVQRADGAIATVAEGRGITDEAVQAMTRVSESAKGIDSVIEGLDKIAFQTRVLAMNAAVEAGRAGEAGRGFAVVADLVSALAMRSEEEAARARDQLTATQTDIIAAVEMVQKVDHALADISGGVSEVHTLLGQMASDNQAQSTAITQISVAVGTMDTSTQQNAAMVEETSAAARNLTSEVAVLADQAGKFNTGSAGYVPPSRPAPARSAAKPAKASGYVSPVKPLPAMASASHDDWTSF